MTKPKQNQKKTTKLPKEIEEFLERYREWRKKYMDSKTEGSIPPDDDPPNPPGGDDDDGK